MIAPKKRVPVQIAVLTSATGSTITTGSIVVLADDGAWFQFFPSSGKFLELPDLPQPEKPRVDLSKRGDLAG